MILSEFQILPTAEARAAILVGALCLDAVLGEPSWLWQRIRHPIVAIGNLVAFCDRRLNLSTDTPNRRRMNGVMTIAALLFAGMVFSIAISGVLNTHPILLGVEAIVVAILLATRSLYDHVKNVASELRNNGLAAGRRAVSMIVGRDPEHLDESGVARAAIESTAENFADGVVAPAFWFLVAGLPGILLYKIINTADSMIGHKTERHLHFGWAAARIDDLANFIPARISGLLIATASALCGRNARDAFATMWRDAAKHASPNAGWPETAMAGALGIALAGPRKYAEHTSTDPWLNDQARKDTNADDIFAALSVMVAATLVMGAFVAGILTVLQM